jgi:membrane-associated phospholipid phosphatase
MVVLDMVNGSIKTRSSARDFPSVHLMAGIIVLVIALSLFALVAANVVNAVGLTSVDVQLALWLHEHSSPRLTQCLLVLTDLHDTIAISVVSALITLYLVWKKRWYAALAALLVAFSRMYLGAHYLSDVLAGFLEGIAWLALCLTAIQAYRNYRQADG